MNYPDISNEIMVSIDIETKDPGLRKRGPGVRRDGHIVGVAVATPTICEYYPLRHKVGTNADWSNTMRWLDDQMRGFTGEVITANGLYDADYLAHEGITWPRATWRDIQVAEAILDANRGQYKLDKLAKYYLGHGKAATDILETLYGKDWIQRFDEVETSLATIYGKGDAQDTLDIWNIQREAFKKNHHHARVLDIESRLLPMLLYMRRIGVRVDNEEANRVSNRFYLEEQEICQMVEHETGIKPRLWAARNLATIMDKIDVKYGLTKTEEPSITKALLEGNPHPVCQGLARARRISKLRRTFINGYIIEGQTNGRIHCEFKPTKSDTGGAITGRFSSANPNLQNIPSRDGELAPIMRGFFIPEEGHEWCSLDWSQIEYRLLVHYAFMKKLAGAAQAVRAFRTVPTTDYHKFVMDLTGLERKPAKSVNFGRIYGMGVQALAMTLGVSIAEAQRIVDKYNAKIPYAAGMMKEVSNAANARGYIRTLGGRIHRFEEWQSKDFDTGMEDGAGTKEWALEKYGKYGVKRAWTYKGLNYLIQGSAADIMKKAMVDIWEAGLTTGTGGPLAVHLTVHDELDFSMPKTAEGIEAYWEAKHIMETSTKLQLPILADGELGPSWGQLIKEKDYFKEAA